MLVLIEGSLVSSMEVSFLVTFAFAGRMNKQSSSDESLTLSESSAEEEIYFCFFATELAYGLDLSGSSQTS